MANQINIDKAIEIMCRADFMHAGLDPETDMTEVKGFGGDFRLRWESAKPVMATILAELMASGVLDGGKLWTDPPLWVIKSPSGRYVAIGGTEKMAVQQLLNGTETVQGATWASFKSAGFSSVKVAIKEVV
jgi:hypothetical protein